MSVDDILDSRHQTYGTFMELSKVAVGLRELLWVRPMPCADQAEALTMICTKLARIVNGDPNDVDSWRDIAGYATLVADRLEGKIR